MFYYAVLNENMFVVDLVVSETAITDSRYIEITEDQYTNGDLLWLYYKPATNEFIVCDNWIGSSDWIYFKNTDRPITPKFDEIDSQIAGKANLVHSHDLGDIAETDSQKIMTAAERVKLSGIAENANNYVHPNTHPASIITGLADVATTGSYNDLTDKPAISEAYTHPATHPASMITGLSSVATSGSYDDLTDKPTIPTVPESLPANGGNADTVDGYHASAFATAQHNHDAAYASADHTHTNFAAASHTHGQSDITGLTNALSEKANASHTHGEATTSTAGFMSATDKTKLNGIATNANNYTHPATHAASMITGLASVATSGSYTDLTNLPSSCTPSAHTHAQSDITGLASALNSKAVANHTHTASDVGAISTDLLITSTTGAFKYSYTTADNKNVLDDIKGLPSGLFTVYSQAGVAGNPKTTEAWRMLVHKTGNTVLWVKAFGSLGSEFSNYCADGVWQGWRCIYDVAPVPLWSGDMYMAASHTIVPSKALSKCANGWLLLWSDYNPGASVQNVDFASTLIPKRAYNGALWNNHQWLCAVPRYSNEEGEGIIVKTLHISDTQITGNSLNNASPRNDVVLRAVMEY